MISVCLTVYNGEKYIVEQINSILPQLGIDDEIIVSDDSSSDKTLFKIAELKDKRVIVLKGNNFKSPIYNLENALKHVKGEYVFLCDQDDVWLPNKVEESIKHITENNIVMSDAMLVDENLNIISETLDTWRIYKSGYFVNLYKGRYIGCCMAFHQKKLKQILPFPENLPAHDVWIGLLGELSGGVDYISIPLIKYRRHDKNFSTASDKSKNNLLYMISYRFKFLYLTLFRNIKYFLIK